MYYKWLQAFHAVAVNQSFTIASNVLGIGQPTLSIHVANLEKHFEIELFYRRNRKVTLTPLGKTLLTITKGLYGYEREAIALLQASKEMNTGELRIHATVAYDVMEVLETFRSKHPKIVSKVTLGNEHEVLKSLEQFSSDIGVIGRAITDNRYSSYFFSRHEVKAIFNTSHPLAQRRKISLEDLDGYHMILRPKSSTTRQAFEAAVKNTKFKIHTVMEMNSREAIREAVIRGFGFGVMSEPAFYPHEKLRAISFSDVNIFTEVYIVCLSERRERTILDEFFSAAKQLREHKIQQKLSQ